MISIPRKRIDGTVIIFFIVIILGCAVLGFGYRDTRSAKESLTWPETRGIVTASFVEEYKHIDDYEPTYTPRVGYSYTVDGRMYSNDLISFEINAIRNRSEKTKSWAETVISDYPKDGSVTVYYNPSDPRVSVLQRGSATDWKVFWGYLFIGIGVIGVLFLMMKKEE